MTTTPFYITTPIYYVNDIPHIGHAYTTIAADVLARYWRLRGRNVYFLTGLDEHGQKVQQAAAKAGIEPQIHCDRLTPQFQDLWTTLLIDNDGFIRTTDRGHQRVVQRFLQTLYDKDLIYRAAYTGWYCTFDERFWTEKDVEGGLCPDCRRPVEQLSENNYFFRMGRYREQLQQHIHDHPHFIRPVSRRNEVLGFLEQPLEDLSISRPKARLSWGIPLPFDQDYVTYVWFDALSNYVSALEYLPNRRSTEHYWPASVHLVGKDILTTHAVYWSTMLMALDLPLPHTIFAHGWWTVDGEKMSKSRGNVVDPHAMVRDYGVDAFRYFLLREVPFGQDGDFSQSGMTARYNAELANDLGNLVSRTITMVTRYNDGAIPAPSATDDDPRDLQLRHAAEQLSGTVDAHLANFEFNRALESIFGLVQLTNQYIDKNAPWTLAKDPANTPRLHTVLFHAVEALRFACVLLAPFIPRTAQAMSDQLGFAISFKDAPLTDGLCWSPPPTERRVTKGPVLFPRKDLQPSHEKGTPVTDQITPPDATAPNDAHAPVDAPKTDLAPAEDLITIDDFMNVQLKVAKILAAERVPKSNKLLKLQVDVGTERRQIVAGIGKAYEPEQLVGRTVVIVANLKPATLMGVESQGMVLAAGGKNVVGLLTVQEDAEPGTLVK